MNHVSLIRDLYSAFGSRDEKRLRELMSPQIEWIQCAGFPGGGHRHGVDAVLEKVFDALQSEWNDFKAEIDEYHDAGSTVIAIGRYSGTHSKTGRAMESLFAHVYDVADGRVQRFRQITDTAPIVDALEDR